MAHDLMDQVVRAKAAKDADNKREWEDEQRGNPYRQQNKRREVVRAYADGSCNRKGYVETLPLCDIAKAAKDADNKREWEDEQRGNPYRQQNKRREVVRAYAAGSCNRKGYVETLPLCDMFNLHHHHDPFPLNVKYCSDLEDHNEAVEAYQDPNVAMRHESNRQGFASNVKTISKRARNEKSTRRNPLGPKNVQWKLEFESLEYLTMISTRANTLLSQSIPSTLRTYDPEHVGVSFRLEENKNDVFFGIRMGVGLYSEVQSRLDSTRSGLSKGEIVKAELELLRFWPSIRDDEFVIGGTVVKK
nr:hypothetical protein [Tanacetum cinerariifolium]